MPADEHAAFGRADQIGYGLLVLAVDGLAVEAYCVDVVGEKKVPGREILRLTEQVRHDLAGAGQIESPEVTVFDVVDKVWALVLGEKEVPDEAGA